MLFVTALLYDCFSEIIGSLKKTVWFSGKPYIATDGLLFDVMLV